MAESGGAARDSGGGGGSARAVLVGQLMAAVRRAAAEGDGEAARIAHEALGRLLVAPASGMRGTM